MILSKWIVCSIKITELFSDEGANCISFISLWTLLFLITDTSIGLHRSLTHTQTTFDITLQLEYNQKAPGLLQMDSVFPK